MLAATVACASCGTTVNSIQIVCSDCTVLEAGSDRGPVQLPDGVKQAFGSCCLTARDYALLESYLDQAGARDAFTGRLVKSKLAAVRIVLPSDVGPEVATLNSRVVFRLDGRAPEARVLVHWGHGLAVGITLPVTTPLGIALLGMKAGEEAEVLLRGGGAWGLRLEEVAYQPERVREAAQEPFRRTLLKGSAK